MKTTGSNEHHRNPVIIRGVLLLRGMTNAGRRVRVINSAEELSSAKIHAGIRELVNRGGTAPLGRGKVIAGSNPASGVLFEDLESENESARIRQLFSVK